MHGGVEVLLASSPYAYDSETGDKHRSDVPLGLNANIFTRTGKNSKKNYQFLKPPLSEMYGSP